jgi:hypothetical protein
MMNEQGTAGHPFVLSLLLALGALGAAPGAQASLIGTDVDVSVIEFTDPVLTVHHAETVTVLDPGVEIAGLFGSFDVDIGAESIRIDVLASGAIGTADFFGFQFESLNWSPIPGEITGFSNIDSNIVGIDISRFISTADAVAINLQGLTLAQGDFVDVTLAVQHDVPAPPALGLLVGSLGLLGWISGRRRRRR